MWGTMGYYCLVNTFVANQITYIHRWDSYCSTTRNFWETIHGFVGQLILCVDLVALRCEASTSSRCLKMGSKHGSFHGKNQVLSHGDFRSTLFPTQEALSVPHHGREWWAIL